MENDTMKKCPFCAEDIKQEAIKCRFCGSMLNKKEIKLDFLSTPGYWHRVNEGKKVAGVCTGVATQLDSSVLILPLRLFFILTTIFYGFGAILYIFMWVLMPAPTDFPGGDSSTIVTPPPSPGGNDVPDSPVETSPPEVTVTVETPKPADTPEPDKQDEPGETDQSSTMERAKMRHANVPATLSMLGFIVVSLVLVYSFVLNIVAGINVSFILLIIGCIMAILPLAAITIIMHFNKSRTPVIKTA